MSRVFLSPRNLIVSAVLFIASSALAYAASIIGIDDNPPGIALAYLSSVALVLIFFHSIRASHSYRYLMLASVVGFALFTVLHALVEGVVPSVGGALFLIAILVCPSALLVGAIGTVLMSRRERLAKEQSSSG